MIRPPTRRSTGGTGGTGRPRTRSRIDCRHSHPLSSFHHTVTRNHGRTGKARCSDSRQAVGKRPCSSVSDSAERAAPAEGTMTHAPAHAAEIRTRPTARVAPDERRTTHSGRFVHHSIHLSIRSRPRTRINTPAAMRKSPRPATTVGWRLPSAASTRVPPSPTRIAAPAGSTHHLPESRETSNTSGWGKATHPAPRAASNRPTAKTGVDTARSLSEPGTARRAPLRRLRAADGFSPLCKRNCTR